MANKKNRPTDPELNILKTLWQRSPQSAKEIHGHVEQNLQWSFSSTRKTLDRMVEKQFLAVAPGERGQGYTPLVGKVNTLAAYIGDLMHRVLELNKMPPVHLFVDSELLDNKEMAELETLLGQLEQDKQSE
ncbi:MAG: BlaI/MecI/CopY family transcriptional regulator [Gammaproteobacteria bacterium]|nr:BlaI/MecI/CopY family transcriptional regulator [Gammaproteobacteria bacterium]